MVQLQGQVGEVFGGPGANVTLRQMPDAGLAVSILHGKRFGQNYYNRLFHAANEAAQALSLLAATTYTGLALWNPVGSNVLVSVEEVTTGIVTLPTAASGVVLFGFTGTPSAFTTPVGTYPGKLQAGQSLSVTAQNKSAAAAYSALTLVAAPAAANAPILRALASYLGVSTDATSLQPIAKDEVSGSILLEPGTGVGIVAVTTAVSIIGSFTWEELPIQNFSG